MFARIRRYPRLLFFALGCLVALAGFFLYSATYDLARHLGSGGLAYVNMPGWLRATQRALEQWPWIVLALAIAARLYYGRRIRLFSFAAGVATPYLALVAFLFFGPPIEDHWYRQTFDASRWRTATDDAGSKWPVRLGMADDLVNSGLLRGKTKAEIETLLGPRTDTDKFQSWDLVYYLGPERDWLSLDSEWLVVKFGPDGKARDIAVVHD